ncbi:MAG: SPOR domain-containing protein [Treponema sp.]|jgi:DedD protein|nr:SPOR domain-containing protein [Treponema sp.]
MEKKKLLSIAVSVGIFLVIIISSILIISPKGRTPQTAFASAPPVVAGSPAPGNVPGTIGPVDMVRSSGDIEPLAPLRDAGETRFYIDGGQLEGQPQGNRGAAPSGTVITVAKPSAVAVPETSAPRVSRPVVRPSAPVTAPPAPKPAVKPAPVKPVEKPAADTQYYNDYWVQTGAFSTKVRAEGAKETLARKGITSIIENREINGKVWYRVRVGPYTSENEAHYWLALVKSIDGFTESQVRQSKTLR